MAPVPRSRPGGPVTDWELAALGRIKQDHFEGLTAVDKNSLKAEERSIKVTRARLERVEAKRHYLTDVEETFKQWRVEAWEREEPKKKLQTSFEQRGSSSEIPGNCLKPQLCPEYDAHQSSHGDDDPGHDLRAGFMFFERQDQGCKGVTYHKTPYPDDEDFPNQRLTVHDALYHKEHNAFAPTRDGKGNRHLRHIHLPANHMGWVEQAMARYHGEDGLESNKRIKANRTLSREHWEGQVHGSGLGKSATHARHMRSRFALIPRAYKKQKTSGNLCSTTEWSTDRPVRGKESDFAIFVGLCVNSTRLIDIDECFQLPYLHWETSSRRASMARTIREVSNETRNKHTWEKTFKGINKSKLGKYLLALARLWEAMYTEVNDRLLRHGLATKDSNSESPLHVRRTLDQVYFVNSKDTTERDKDQVVYRATRKPFKDAGHGDATRIMMVHQLWLWILDDYTIITCFPKRWGRNKPDSSGIHKSFRERLIHLDNEVMSVWHLAFLIIDQCSRVFFDRTKPLDMRPEVMDIFAESLGVVNDYKAVAYETFWRNVEVAAKTLQYGPPAPPPSKVPNSRYLHINPEGKLLQEAQDIAEELRIMIDIYAQQLSVVKDFHKCLEQLNGGPIGARDRDLKRLVRHLSVMWEHQTKVATTKTFQSLGELESLDDMIEEIESRKNEIEDLESAALRTCQQLQELLSLKQQQAGIIEAKAALDRAGESVEQGKAIMAFTIMTVVFTPLGFFTSFFGMNNSATGQDWMTLGLQCAYMFCISLMIIFVLVLAFNKRLRRPFEPLEKLWKDRNKPRKESRHVRQERGKSVETVIWPSPARGGAMGSYHLGVPQEQRRADGQHKYQMT
ncbi:hypothetical protein VPNG_05850 [Cytospora leucostoma]|uniref:Uncharacterized protein n=1 Tax=Cytospora leucostoma TaxID=1230097 RepID=A0A423X0N6_9PEZI|nr:hypothetical protein VPNG_05850 [Cytospora leucostoma]